MARINDNGPNMKRAILGTRDDNDFFFANSRAVAVGGKGDDTFNSSSGFTNTIADMDQFYGGGVPLNVKQDVAGIRQGEISSGKFSLKNTGDDIAHVGAFDSFLGGDGNDLMVLHGGHYASPAVYRGANLANDDFLFAHDRGFALTGFRTGKRWEDRDGDTHVNIVEFTVRGRDSSPIENGQALRVLLNESKMMTNDRPYRLNLELDEGESVRDALMDTLLAHDGGADAWFL